MYDAAAKKLKNVKKDIAASVTEYVKKNFPERTDNFNKCTRDVCYILDSLEYCLIDGNFIPAENIAEMFYTRGNLALRSTIVEFIAYDYMLELIKENLDKAAADHCVSAIGIIKNKLSND